MIDDNSTIVPVIEEKTEVIQAILVGTLETTMKKNINLDLLAISGAVMAIIEKDQKLVFLML